MGRRGLGLFLGCILLAGCNSQAAPSGSGTGAAPTGASSGAPPAGGSAAPGSKIEASIVTSVDAFAAYEDALADEVIRRSGVLAAIGQEGWDWARASIHEELVKGGETITLTGEAGLMASLLGGPPQTAIQLGFGGYGAAGAAIMIQQALQGSGPNVSGANPGPVTSTRTVNGQTLTGSMTWNMGVTTAGTTVEGDVTIGFDLTVTDAATGALIHQSHFSSHGKIKLDFCPDVNGKVKGHVSLDMQAGAVGAGAAGVSVEADIEGTVGEDAYLNTVDITGQSNQTTTAAGGGGPRSQQVQLGYRAGVNRNGTINNGSISNVTGGPISGPADMTQAEYDEGEAQIVSAASVAVWAMGDAAQKKWRSGACVEIRATEQSRDVQKNELVQFESKVFHKIDGNELNKKIVNELSGVSSLDPVGIEIAAPVTNSFKAGPKVDDVGTITMTTTSNRGIGTLTLAFRVKGGWFIDHPNMGGRMTGLKCGDPTGTWVVDGTYSIMGLRGTQTWTIDIGVDAVHGTYTYKTKLSGNPGGGPVAVKVTGTAYGKVTLTIQADGTAHMVLDEIDHEYHSDNAFSVGGFISDFPIDWEVGGAC